MDAQFDIVVIGGGHAGVEAAAASARLGLRALLLCGELGTVANMPCNPAIGGTAKGQLVREVDALGGCMGVVADKALLQMKMLNSAKGAAVYSPRGQADKRRYHDAMLEHLGGISGLTLWADEAVGLAAEDGSIACVRTRDHGDISAKACVLATGVYLNGRIIIGNYIKESGPVGFAAYTRLADSLRSLGLPLRRFKTGTPARIYRDSINFDAMTPQWGDGMLKFSFMSPQPVYEEEPCYLSYTNADTHRIIMDNISRSPLYDGTISGVGPRYCPSIETKVMRFADKERHQIFVEPEGAGSPLMYVQGMSTSLPHDVQEKMYRTIPGLENCRFARYGYAIEYDCLDPLGLKPSLELKAVKGLFSAGQFNGSSGYEEAAAQGVIAGINAARYVKGQSPVVLGRDEAYIGVLIDDLVTKGTEEPYRMMTSRAEHRIFLRQDNADLRLTPIGYELGLASEERYKRMLQKKEQIDRVLALKDVPADRTAATEIFDAIGEQMPAHAPTFGEICRRPAVTVQLAKRLVDFDVPYEALEEAVIQIKYEGYLKKEEALVKEQRRLEQKKIPENFDYLSVRALRIEARQKLDAVRPQNLGQASRISGVSPADIAVLIVCLRQAEADRGQ